MTAVACKDCAAPIAQPAGSGHPRMFCAACVARRRKQQSAERMAAWTPERRAKRAEVQRDWRAGRSPEQIAADAQYNHEWHASRTPEKRAARVLADRERYAASPEKRAARARMVRDTQLRRCYGIGIADFDAKLAAQGGRCAICGTDEPKGKGWHIDHDHESGAVRGILCSGCNTGGGLYKEDPAVLRAAADYFESYIRRAS